MRNKPKKQNQLKILMKSIREYKKESILTPLLVIIEVVLEVLIPLLMAEMIDQMTGDTMTPIYKFGTVLIFMAFASLFSGMLAGKFGATASTGFAKNLRKDLFYKIQDYSFKEIDGFSSSSLVTRLTTDVTNVQNAYQMVIRIAIRTPLMMTFAFIMSFSISWELGLIFVVAIPLLGGGLTIILKKVFPIFKVIFKKYDHLNKSVQENVDGIRVVKSFVREDYEKNKFNDAANEIKNDFTKAEKLIALNNPLMMFSMYVVTLLISYFGAKMIISSAGVDLTTGELSTLITYSTMILMSVMMFSMVFVMIAISNESINRIAEVLSTESSLDLHTSGIKKIKDGSITFKNVCFKYSENADKNALENINIDIKSGQTIGILGVTGSSKTTFVQLIPRLYDATQGEVFVGGENVRSYDLKSLREEVAFVLQKNVLFSGTILENLRWGNKNASLEEVKEAAELACASEFIEQFPLKYDTYIERGGTNVSGGQKQRLSIARALLKKPKIIIFDDSTSAVDTKTDAKIREAMAKMIPDTTKIVIAQRVDSVKDADKIAIFENGHIIAFGSHDELIKTNDSYKSIYDSQVKHDGGEQA
jgi:ATP-binding cassette subfamily B protein